MSRMLTARMSVSQNIVDRPLTLADILAPEPLPDAPQSRTQCERAKGHRHSSGRLDCPRCAQTKPPTFSPDLFSLRVESGVAIDFDPTNAREAAAAFIAAAYRWLLMLTITNSPYGGQVVTATAPGARESRPHFVSEAAADKRFANGMNRLNQLVFGRRYWKRPGLGFTWAGTMEFQKSGNPHHHAVLYTPGLSFLTRLEVTAIGCRRIVPAIEQCFREAGAGPVIRAEVCARPEDAARYITKACRYITKTDGLSWGGPWPRR